MTNQANQIHLRSRKESVSVLCLIYYLPYKIILTFVNIASCYYSIYKYAKYFAKRHPKIIEDEKAVAVVLRLEEESHSDADKAASIYGRASGDKISHPGRRFTITAVGTNLSSVIPQEFQQGDDATNVDVVDFAAGLAPLPYDSTSNESARKKGRMSPPIPPARRPFSWHRSTSKASSGSGISPFHELNQPQFPLQSPVMTGVGQSLEEVDPIPNRVESPPLAHRSFSTALLRRRSSDRGLSFRRSPSPQLSSGTPRPSSTTIPLLYQRMLRHHSSNTKDPILDLSTPTIEPPPPALLSGPYHFAALEKVEEVARRGPPRKVEPDMNRYISALADTDRASFGSKDRLFIREEDEEDEGIEARRKEEPIRRSTQTDRTSWASRKSRVYIC